MNWREYWNQPHPIYLNARHRALHFDLIARDIATRFRGRAAVVLDYGCGKLPLFDAADTVRERLAARHAGDDRIAVLDERALNDLPEGSLDLIVVNSVAQYLAPSELDDLLDFARDKLKPRGEIALGDVIPVHAGALSDTLALPGFA